MQSLVEETNSILHQESNNVMNLNIAN